MLLEIMANDPTISVYKAGVLAGFAPSTMNKQGKRVIETALERARALSELHREEKGERKEIQLYDRVGIPRENVLKEYRYVIEQQRDMSSKLKAMAPLLKQEGIDLTSGTEQTQAPVINIVSVRNDTPTQAEYRVVEPQNE